MAIKKQPAENQSRRPHGLSTPQTDGTQHNPELAAEFGAPGLLLDDGEVLQRHSAKLFPIVGVGASASGLAAFTQLLQALSPNLRMAIVFVQHLSPEHESLLFPLLSR